MVFSLSFDMALFLPGGACQTRMFRKKKWLRAANKGVLSCQDSRWVRILTQSACTLTDRGTMGQSVQWGVGATEGTVLLLSTAAECILRTGQRSMRGRPEQLWPRIVRHHFQAQLQKWKRTLGESKKVCSRCILKAAREPSDTRASGGRTDRARARSRDTHQQRLQVERRLRVPHQALQLAEPTLQPALGSRRHGSASARPLPATASTAVRRHESVLALLKATSCRDLSEVPVPALAGSRTSLGASCEFKCDPAD